MPGRHKKRSPSQNIRAAKRRTPGKAGRFKKAKRAASKRGRR